MTRLLRATELVGNPVVTLDGESELEVRDILFEPASGKVLGFTLRRKGFLGKPLRGAGLPCSAVRGIGRDAVIVSSHEVLETGFDPGPAADVLGDRVLTDDGACLGEVTDLVIEVGAAGADVVGFEVKPSEALQRDAKRVFIPLPDTISISGANVMVPAGARDYVALDLTGFGGSVARFRAQIDGADRHQ